MASKEPGKSQVGSSTPASNHAHQGPSLQSSVSGGCPSRQRSDQHQNPFKTPLLKKVQARSRHVTREESRIKHTWVYIMTFSAVMGNIALGYGIGYSSPIQDQISFDLNLSVSEFSTFGSLITVGAMAGALVSGPTADYCGRKGGLVLACIPSLVGFLSIAFAQNPIFLYVGRFLNGLAGGVVCYIVPTLVGEAAPRHLRGFLGTMQQLCVTLGILFVYLSGLFLNWRILAAAGVIPSIVSLIGLTFVPESPYWLAKMERAEDLQTSLQKLRGQDYNITREMSEIQASLEAAKQEPKAKFSDLLQRKYSRPLFVGCGLHILQQITGVNGVMLYSTAIFSAAGVDNANVASLALAVLQVVMTFASAQLVDKAGRRLLLLVSSSGMAISLFLVGFSFYLRGMQDERFISSGMNIFIDILALASLLVYIAAFSLGYGPVPWVMLSELFPIKVKALAGSTASLVNWSSAWIVTLTFNFLLQWSNPGTFWLFGVTSVFAVIFTALFVPETRGKTLDQIQQSFK